METFIEYLLIPLFWIIWIIGTILAPLKELTFTHWLLIWIGLSLYCIYSVIQRLYSAICDLRSDLKPDNLVERGLDRIEHNSEVIKVMLKEKFKYINEIPYGPDERMDDDDILYPSPP